MTYKTVNSNYCQLPILNIDANNITSMTNNMHESRASYRDPFGQNLAVSEFRTKVV